MQYINKRSELSQDQLNLFLKVFAGNSQVFDEWTARKFTRKICEQKGIEDDSLIEKLIGVYPELKNRKVVHRKPEKEKALTRKLSFAEFFDDEGDSFLLGFGYLGWCMV